MYTDAYVHLNEIANKNALILAQQRSEWSEHWTRSQKIQIPKLYMPLICCVTLEKSLTPSVSVSLPVKGEYYPHIH